MRKAQAKRNSVVSVGKSGHLTKETTEILKKDRDIDEYQLPKEDLNLLVMVVQRTKDHAKEAHHGNEGHPVRSAGLHKTKIVVRM